MPTSKLFAPWTFRIQVQSPFDACSTVNTSVYSKYNSASSKKSTLHAPTVSALLKFVRLLNASEEGEDTTGMGAIGFQGDKYVTTEYCGSKGITCTAYAINTGRFFSGFFASSAASPTAYTLGEAKQTGAAILFSLLPIMAEDDEFKESLDELRQHAKAGYTDPDAAAQSMYLLCDHVYRRIENAASLGDAGIAAIIPATGNVPQLTETTIKAGNYSPSSVLYGEFGIMEVSAGGTTTPSKSLDHADYVGKYQLNTSRVLSEQEQARVPILGTHIIIPEDAGLICKHLVQTTASASPIRNVMLRGPSGTGKTILSRIISSGINQPYVFQTCSANSEISDFIGQYLPDTNDPDVAGLIQEQGLPTLLDIQMDPATAYEMMTGEYHEEITEDAVLYALARHLNNALGDNVKKGFVYIESPLIKAMKYGYLCELQEPTVIANPGVLVGLNSLLDDCQETTLANGKLVRRHPDAVIVVTTNIGYAGTRDMNQSFTSRFDLIIDFDEPDIDTTVKRTMGLTGCADAAIVRVMADVVKTINEKCRQTMITDGTCGMRELTAWVQSYMVTKDPYRSALWTIISSASKSQENQEELIATCLEPKFAAK